MTSKERLFNAIQGKGVDHTPWAPFLTYWWEYAGAEIRSMGEIGFYHEIHADPLMRGHFPTEQADSPYRDMFLFEQKIEGCEIVETIKGAEKIQQYRTKIGTLTSRYRIDPQSNTWFLVEHPVKTSEDYQILQYMMEHTVLTPSYDAFHEAVRRYGDDVLFVPVLVPGSKSAFQAMIEHWVGTEEMAYALADEPELVEETIESIRSVSRRAAQIAAESDAEIFLTWEDSSTTNYSPWMYETYILPEINEWCDILHQSGKLYMQHACGHIKDLLPIMARSKIDCLESLSPRPTGNIDMQMVAEILPSSISVIGGIEPVTLLERAPEELDEIVADTLQRMGNRGYVLANSDSCPPGVSIEKFKRISRLV